MDRGLDVMLATERFRERNLRTISQARGAVRGPYRVKYREMRCGAEEDQASVHTV